MLITFLRIYAGMVCGLGFFVAVFYTAQSLVAGNFLIAVLLLGVAAASTCAGVYCIDRRNEQVRDDIKALLRRLAKSADAE